MIINKLEFCDAIGLVLDAALPNIILTIYPDDIFSVKYPKELIVGLNHLLYKIDPWEFVINHSKLSLILDDNGFTLPMDLNNVLNKYMVYITTDKGIYSTFIIFNTTDINFMENTITILCVPIQGVLGLYKNAGITKLNSLTGKLLTVPRNITYNTDLYNYLSNSIYYNTLPFIVDPTYLFLSYIPSINVNFNTIMINIFSNNNKSRLYDSFWDDPTAYDKWWVRSNISGYRLLNLPEQLANYPYSFNPTTIDVALYGDYVDPFSSWKSIIYNYTGLSEETNIINSSSHRKIYEGAGSPRNNWGYGERIGITYKPTPFLGYNFNQIKSGLISAGFFSFFDVSSGNWMFHPVLWNGTGTVTRSGQHILGTTNTVPNGVNTASNPYWSHLPLNDDVTRTPYLDFYAWGYKFYYEGGNYGTVKSKYRRIQFKLNTANPSGFASVIDTGWVHIEQRLSTTNFVNLYPNKFINNDRLLYEDNNYTSLVNNLSDSFLTFDLKTQENMQLEFRHGAFLPSTVYYQYYDAILCNILENVLTSKISIYSLPNILNPKLTNGLSVPVIDLLYQQLLIKYVTLLTYTNTFTGNGYNNSSRTVLKYQTNNLNNVTSYINLQDDNIISYNFIPVGSVNPSLIYSYNILEQDKINILKTTTFYSEVIKNYKLKVQIILFGYDYNIDFIDNRYFSFRNKLYMLTSKQYNNDNTMTILGYGGLNI